MVYSSRDFARLSARYSRLKSASQTLTLLFIFIAAAYCACGMGAMLSLMFENADASVTFWTVSRVAQMGISVGLMCLALFGLGKLFVKSADSPFPFAHCYVRKTRYVGALFCAAAAVKSAEMLTGVLLHHPTQLSGFATVHGAWSLGFIVLSATAAIVCFFLSFIFEYGALLQWLADETV